MPHGMIYAIIVPVNLSRRQRIKTRLALDCPSHLCFCTLPASVFPLASSSGLPLHNLPGYLKLSSTLPILRSLPEQTHGPGVI